MIRTTNKRKNTQVHNWKLLEMDIGHLVMNERLGESEFEIGMMFGQPTTNLKLN